MKICLNCGEPSEQSYCDEHLQEIRKEQRPAKKLTPERRGYDAAWRRLSRKARKLQPFCSDCGATTDLQLDHTPETWERYRARKPITLAHTGGVVCSSCNRQRGDARTPGGGRSTGPEVHSGVQGQTTITHANRSQLKGGGT